MARSTVVGVAGVERVYVGDSSVGQAVFAGRRFRRNQRVAQVTGRVIRDGDYSSDYCMDLGDHTVLEPEPPLRFLNHCCSPNCELIVWEDPDGELELWLHATRSIRAGEELTIDYAWPAEEAIPCRCESSACRGWIVDAADSPRLNAG